jgi:hypothetical protein
MGADAITPPFYRLGTRAGRAKNNVGVNLAFGRHQNNVCVAPVVHIDGKGNKVVDTVRSFSIKGPRVG